MTRTEEGYIVLLPSVCPKTTEPIHPERLEALLEVVLCLACKASNEKHTRTSNGWGLRQTMLNNQWYREYGSNDGYLY